MSTRSIAIIYNPASGQLDVRPGLERVEDLLRQRGFTVSIAETTTPGEATSLARRMARQAEIVVAAGGDGTVSEVANGLAGTETAMGVLPTGTTNVWAMQVGIPVLPPMGPRKMAARLLSEWDQPEMSQRLYIDTLLDAARIIVEGEHRPVDLGKINDRHFLLWAGAGFDAEVTEHVDTRQKRRLGAWAYLITGFVVAREYAGRKVTLIADDIELRERIILAVISNARLYGGIVEVAPRAYLDDGLLDVVIFRGEGFPSTLRHVLHIFARRHLHDPEVIYLQVRSLTIRSPRPMPFHADDEPFTSSEAHIQVVPHALQVIVPPKRADRLFLSVQEARSIVQERAYRRLLERVRGHRLRKRE